MRSGREHSADMMPDGNQRYALFDTAFGICGIAWNGRGLTGVQLPEADASATEARLKRTGAGKAAPSPMAGEAIEALRSYFAGEEIDFDAPNIDLPADVTPARRSIYKAARSLRWGETASYGELARRAGLPGGARAVGQAMAQNPLPIVIPCHRVLASDGRLGGFSAYGGAVQKERLLILERVRLSL
jgi:methylated-DNA-[protein]-cysteine S-methyltransferase